MGVTECNTSISMNISRQPNRRQAQEEDSDVHSYLMPHIFAALQHAHAKDEPRLITLDVLEKAQHFAIVAEIPGVLQDEVILQVDGDILHLSVEKKKTKEQEGVRVHRRERPSSFAARSIRLPESSDFDRIQADVSNGLLEVIIPKRRETGKQRTIKVGSKAGN